MRNYQKSKDNTEKALSIFVASVGGDHPSTLIVKKSLASLEQQIEQEKES
jgi:hypothetical protein